MIYKIINNDKVLDIDDTLLFYQQPFDFKNQFEKRSKNNMAEFDNCIILLLDSGRIIVNNINYDK